MATSCSPFQLRLYAESSTESEDLEVKVVAAENRKQDNHSEKVALFFSLAIGLPLAAIVLIWVGVHGAFPYIRSHINDSEIFPNVAALYWIGQTFTLFVIAMDVVALSENSTIDEYDKLEYYQLLFLSLITILEIVGLFICFVFAFISLFSHFRHTNCKIFFQGYFQIMCCGVVSFKQIGRKEARIWLLLNSLVTPLIAALSHSGFIIGGWVSYEDRSFAISLLYFAIFVFLYWSLQYMYKFSTVVFNVRKGTCFKRCQVCCSKELLDGLDGEHDGDHAGNDDGRAGLLDPERAAATNNDETGNDGGHADNDNERARSGTLFDPEKAAATLEDEVTPPSHHEENMAANIQTLRQTGFDTIALFLMTFPLLFLYGIVSYFGFGLVIPLLSSIDTALVHIFTLGQYGFAIAIFLLTYKLFSIKSGGGAQRLISNDALRYWRYLKRGSQINYPILALKRSIEIMDVTLKCIKEDERKLYKFLLKRKEFDLEVVSDRLIKAKERFSGLEGDESSPRRFTLPKDKIVCLKNAAEKLEEYAVKDIKFDKIEEEIETLHKSVKTIRDKKTLTREEKKAVKKLCEGLNHFRKTLVSVIGVPPMYLNRDKASALTAALVYQRINTTHEYPQPHEDNPHNERYSLLLSLIEEEF